MAASCLQAGRALVMQRTKRTTNRVIVAAVGLGVTVAAMAEPLARRNGKAWRDRQTVAGLYVGSEQCRSCHRELVQSFSGSPHPLALRPMSQASAAKELLNAVGSINRGGIDYEYFERDGRLFVRSPSYA